MLQARSPVDLPDPVDVMGMPIRPLRTAELIDALIARAEANLRTTACYANAHTMNIAATSPEFATALREAELLYADGASVVWASRFARKKLPERMTAADYFERFIGRCAKADLSVFFLGGEPGIAHRAAASLSERYPGLRVAGCRHGFFEASESPAVIETINAARPDVLIAGLSSPRQERWLARYGNELNVPVRWCVGAAMDYVAGAESRAPQWLCRMGGEWLYRLIVDPVGKWRRYIIGNPLFVLRALKWAMTKQPASAATFETARMNTKPTRPRRDKTLAVAGVDSLKP